MKKYHLWIVIPTGNNGIKIQLEATDFLINSGAYVFRVNGKPISYYPVNRTVIQKIEEI